MLQEFHCFNVKDDDSSHLQSALYLKISHFTNPQFAMDGSAKLGCRGIMDVALAAR